MGTGAVDWELAFHTAYSYLILGTPYRPLSPTKSDDYRTTKQTEYGLNNTKQNQKQTWNVNSFGSRSLQM